jgi:hypothetical protein
MANFSATSLDGARVAAALVPGQTPSAGTDNATCLGYTVVHVTNTGAGAVNFTVKSEPDGSDRLADAVHSIPAGGEVVFGPFKFSQGWATPSGKMNFVAGTPADTVVRIMEVNKN